MRKSVSVKKQTSYSLLLTPEASEQQWHDLLQDMLSDVKQKASRANKKLEQEQAKQLKIAQNFWEKRHLITLED